MTLQLRSYQSEAIEATYSYFRDHDGAALIVLPTGSGKSLVLAGLCYDLVKNYPGMRIVVLSHSIELIEQDCNKLKEYWARAPCGVFSASLGKKQAQHPITFATIQSVYKKAHVLGHRTLICIDEAHLLSRKTDGMYNMLIARLKEINPQVRLLGLTASPFRVDSGMLTDGDDAMFDDICYEATLISMIKAGYLSRLVSKSSLLQADLSRVKITAGEFNAADMEMAFEKDGFTEAVLDEALPLLDGRRSVMVFCTGIDHANHVCAALRSRGCSAEAVSSKTPKTERRRILEGFKNQEFRFICSMALITTGYDCPAVDGILMVRATMSPGLFLQIAGRGLRKHPGKTECLFLDYGQNITRLGPITHLSVPRRRGKGRKKDDEPEGAKVRICELCRTASPLDTLECPECGNPLVKERDPTAKLETKAADVDILMSDEEYLEKTTVWADVDSVRYRRHIKEGKPDSIRVEYQCGMMVYKEWVCLFHGNFAEKKARMWWSRRGGESVEGIDAALTMAEGLSKPNRIRVRKNDKHFEVLDHEFETGAAREGNAA